MSSQGAIIITVSMAKKKSKIYSVSQINSLIKVVLEENLPSRVIISGEISDWKHHISGHCYFSLKDKNALLPCVMWASDFKRLKFSPENGIAVLASGHIDIYTIGGKYQLYVKKLEPSGVGELQLAFEQMVKRLQAQGFFEDEHKKILPAYPERIGIVTSESGAAVEDIRNSIGTRWPCVKLLLYPVPVQGEGSAEKIAAAITDINRRNKELKLDILIVGRGGGSLEDLWAFNEECVATAIFNSKIPIISAVGHEVDITIADLVADARASTPTKAGIVAVPDMQEVLGQLDYFQKSLASKAGWQLQLCTENLQTLLASAVFRNPLLPVRNREQLLDDIQAKLADSIKGAFAQAKDRLRSYYEKITTIEPHRLLGKENLNLNNLQNRVQSAMRDVTSNCRMQLTAKENRLAGLDPKTVLKRGYSITTNKRTGLLVRSLKDVELGDLLKTELADENLIESKVKKKQNRAD